MDLSDDEAEPERAAALLTRNPKPSDADIDAAEDAEAKAPEISMASPALAPTWMFSAAPLREPLSSSRPLYWVVDKASMSAIRAVTSSDKNCATKTATVIAMIAYVPGAVA